RLSASAIATLPRSWAGRLPNAPLKAPTGVRAALTMTISFFMFWAPLVGPRFDRAKIDQAIRPSRTGCIWGSFGFRATPANWHLGYPWPVGGWRVNETKGRTDLRQCSRTTQHHGINMTKRWLAPRKGLCWLPPEAELNPDGGRPQTQIDQALRQPPA